ENHPERPIVEVGLCDLKVTDGQLRAMATLLPDLPDLRALDLNCDRITDANIKPFSRLRKLRQLTIYNSHLTDEGFKPLSGLAGLDEFSFDGREATGSGLTALASLKKLRHLYLGRVTRPGLKVVGTLQQLESVSLSYPGDEAGALGELAALKNL